MPKRHQSVLSIPGRHTAPSRARSRFNALKHGVLAAAAVLGDESPQEYAELVAELARVLQPEGRLEEALVEKIASTLWRYRRLLQSESAEISALRLHEGKTLLDDIRSQMFAGGMSSGSLQWAILTRNVPALLADLEDLKRLAHRVSDEGLDWERDRETLERIFGKRTAREKPILQSEDAPDPEVPSLHVAAEPDATILGTYLQLVRESEGQGRAARREAAEQLAGKLLDMVSAIEPDAHAAVERSRRHSELRRIRALVPPDKAAEKLIRYEAHLDRVLDRALTQLERLQRLRRGQPVPPPLKVELSR